jgi:hypothetical protein
MKDRNKEIGLLGMRPIVGNAAPTAAREQAVIRSPISPTLRSELPKLGGEKAARVRAADRRR